jgi:hypothetical protein
LETIVEALRGSHYSVHDFSRFTGEGLNNHARMNMPIEMGMAVFHAIETQRRDHRCVFFVPTPNDYQAFASDLAGLDPKCHYNDEERLISEMYEWLRAVVPAALFNSKPTIEVVAKYREFKVRIPLIVGSGPAGKPSHEEGRELMYQMCSEADWWDWRKNRQGQEEFPILPIRWQEL